MPVKDSTMNLRVSNEMRAAASAAAAEQGVTVSDVIRTALTDLIGKRTE